MSKPRYRWWQYAIKMVQDFPTLDAAINLSRDDRRDRNAVAGAIEATMKLPQGKQRLKLISAVYWADRRQTIEETAVQLSVTGAVAESWHGDFIRAVGKCWGFHTNQPSKRRGSRRERSKLLAETENEGQSL